MPDPAGFDAHQDRLRKEVSLGHRRHILRQALRELAPRRDSNDLSYMDVVMRLREALESEQTAIEEATTHG
jgi:hypothetical protein